MLAHFSVCMLEKMFDKYIVNALSSFKFLSGTDRSYRPSSSRPCSSRTSSYRPSSYQPSSYRPSMNRPHEINTQTETHGGYINPAFNPFAEKQMPNVRHSSLCAGSPAHS